MNEVLEKRVSMNSVHSSLYTGGRLYSSMCGGGGFTADKYTYIVHVCSRGFLPESLVQRF
jgi:hypothetical protein